MMADLQVADRLAQVREKITAACVRAGRPEGSVQLVAVSKRVPLPLVLQACQAGQMVLGENRIQDALERQNTLANLLTTAGLDPQDLRWHFIGHLQRNKAGKAAGQFALIHGVDSVDSAERLSRRCVTDDSTQPILLAVNISAEMQKYGLAPDTVSEAVSRIAELPGLSLQGMMGMGRREATEIELGECFALLRRLCEDTRASTGLALPEISMGMSSDYEIAIAEGATTVRVGSAIFGPRQT